MLFLIKLYGTSSIEKIVGLLTLQQKSIEILMLFHKFLLGTSRFKLMGAYLQRHLLIEGLLLLGIVRNFTLLLRVGANLIYHVIH